LENKRGAPNKKPFPNYWESRKKRFIGGAVPVETGNHAVPNKEDSGQKKKGEEPTSVILERKAHTDGSKLGAKPPWAED